MKLETKEIITLKYADIQCWTRTLRLVNLRETLWLQQKSGSDRNMSESSWTRPRPFLPNCPEKKHTICLCLSICVCACVCVMLCLSLCLSVSLSLSLSLSVCLCPSESVSVSVRLCPFLSVSVRLCPSLSVWVFVSVSLSV